MAYKAREGLERGKGIPFTDVERAARHYGISTTEAEAMLQTGEITLPARGAGLFSNPTNILSIISICLAAVATIAVCIIAAKK